MCSNKLNLVVGADFHGGPLAKSRVPLISDSDGRVPADWGQESQASSWVEAWNSACLSRCPRGERPLVELYLEPGVFFKVL